MNMGLSQTLMLYANNLLGGYPADDGSILIKKAGAAKDMDLLTPQCIVARRFPATNSELYAIARGKGLTMLGRKPPSRYSYHEVCHRELKQSWHGSVTALQAAMGRQIIPMRAGSPKASFKALDFPRIWCHFSVGLGPRCQQEDNETNSMCIGRCNGAEKAKKEGQRKLQIQGAQKSNITAISKLGCAYKR